MGQSLVKEYINILSKVEDSCVKKITASVETYRSFESIVNAAKKRCFQGILLQIANML